MPALNPPASQKTLYSIQQELKSGFKNLCCKLDASGSTYNFIPVYEYRQLGATSFSTQVGSSNLMEIDGSNITFTPSSDVYDICDNYELVQDNLSTIVMFYEDSLGRNHEINGVTTINFANYPNKTIKARIHSYRSSGYKQIEELIIRIDDSPEIFGASILRVYTNTNVSNIQAVVINGLIPTPYEIMVKDILEVRKNGEFEKYVDLNGDDYTPTYCLSYNPVMPFTSLDVPELKVNYDEVEYVEVTASTLSILADTVHTISILSNGGTTDISIDNNLATALLDGQSITFPFSTLNKHAIDISPVSKAYVSLIKPR